MCYSNALGLKRRYILNSSSCPEPIVARGISWKEIELMINEKLAEAFDGKVKVWKDDIDEKPASLAIRASAVSRP